MLNRPVTGTKLKTNSNKTVTRIVMVGSVTDVALRVPIR